MCMLPLGYVCLRAGSSLSLCAVTLRKVNELWASNGMAKGDGNASGFKFTFVVGSVESNSARQACKWKSRGRTNEDEIAE